jgi:hypothetical protein
MKQLSSHSFEDPNNILWPANISTRRANSANALTDKWLNTSIFLSIIIIVERIVWCGGSVVSIVVLQIWGPKANPLPRAWSIDHGDYNRQIFPETESKIVGRLIREAKVL